jgi:flagellar protein FliS
MSLPSRLPEALSSRSLGSFGLRDECDPYALIDLLLDGALDRLEAARQTSLQSERSARLHYLSSALSIITQLRSVVASEGEGGFGTNLKSLYDYMLRRLPAASLHEDTAPIEDVASLMRTIRSAWQSLPAGDTRH